MWRLQNGKDRECRLFQSMADKGHYRLPGQTRQGLYICAPSGKLLSSVNSRDPNEVIKAMSAGLVAWESLPKAERALPFDFPRKPQPRWEDHYPADGLVLSRVCRDIGSELKPAPANRIDRWNRDYVWFSRDEARRWIPADADIGRQQAVPRELVERLARFHFVDNVKGQTLPFTRADVSGSRIEVRIAGRKGPVVELAMRGETRAASGREWDMKGVVWRPEPDHPRGVATRLLGRAEYDLDAGAFTRFEIVALGGRWGWSENNGRKCESECTPIGFVISLSPPEASRRIPPTFIDVYDAEWIRAPGSAFMGSTKD